MNNHNPTSEFSAGALHMFTPLPTTALPNRPRIRKQNIRWSPFVRDCGLIFLNGGVREIFCVLWRSIINSLVL